MRNVFMTFRYGSILEAINLIEYTNKLVEENQMIILIEAEMSLQEIHCRLVKSLVKQDYIYAVFP